MQKLVAVINTLDARHGGSSQAAKSLHEALEAWTAFDPSLLVIKERATGNRTIDVVDRLLTALRETRRSDIVLFHGYYSWWIIVAAMVARRSGRPYLITPHGSLTQRQLKYSVKRKAVFELVVGRWLRAWSDGFVVGSRAEASELRAEFPKATVRVGGLGVDPSGRYSTERTPDGIIRLLTVSRVAPKKRIDVAIRTVRHLLDAGVAASLTVVGEGDKVLTQKLQTLAQDLNISPYVEFVGWKTGDEKERFLLSSHVFLLPSEDENFGIAPVEALATGLPCVVTRAVASSELMAPGAAEVVDIPDPAEFAQRVLRIVQGADQYKARQEAAVANASSDFSWRATATRWNEILQEFVQPRRVQF